MKNKLLILGAAIISLIYFFWILLGEDSFVLVHDNLDSELVYILQLIRSDNVLGLDLGVEVPGIMNGIRRSFFRSGLNITFLIFHFLSPFKAYVVNHAVVHLIGYFGMYHFLKRFFQCLNVEVILALSFIYGTLSYYSVPYGISISGLPLIFLAFFNILQNNLSIVNWIIIIVFPFYSFLPVTLPFVFPVLIIFYFIYLYSAYSRPNSIAFFTALLLFVFINLVVEFNLLFSTFSSDIVSHRTEFSFNSVSLIFESLMNSFNGTPYHAGSMWLWPILLAVLFAKLLNVELSTESRILIVFLFFIFSFWPIVDVVNLYFGKHLGLLKSIEYKRFLFLTPMFLLVLLGSVLEKFDFSKFSHKFFSILLILMTAAGSFRNNPELTENIKIFLNKGTGPTFKSFFAEKQFKEIRDYIQERKVIQDFNVISIGLHPSIAQYNGFKTLDSYQNNYSLEYKHEFRFIIERELEKSEYLMDYFDNWGSRCYAFSSELLLNFPNKRESMGKVIAVPDFNWDRFKNMNGKFILSSCEMDTSQSPNVKLLKSFESIESYWKIWLYEVS